MFGSLNKKISEIESKIQDEKTKIDSERIQYENVLSDLQSTIDQLAKISEKYYTGQLKTNTEETDRVQSQKNKTETWGWDTNKLSLWDISNHHIDPYICIGHLAETRNIRPSYRISAYIPFIGHHKTILIFSDRSEIHSLSLVQSIVLRSALMLPHQTRYSLIDPSGHGTAFPMAGELPLIRESSGDTFRDLEEIVKDMRRVIRTYGLAQSKPFENIPEEIRINERFEFIFAANFPKGYDRRDIESLQTIGNTGPIAGKYLFIHVNTKHELPNEMDMKGFENPYPINISEDKYKSACHLKLIPDTAPDENIQQELLTRLKNSRPPERKIDWNKVVGIPNADWWSFKATEFLETPVGSSGSNETLKVWFGARNDKQCVHGILAGMTGSGKSNCYHVIITGLTVRYSPSELQLYLIDGKSGASFQFYKDLPHAQVVSLHTFPELARSILKELIDEKERRDVIFKSIGVEKLEQYKSAGQPQGNMPRLLLLVDEYQELFEDDSDGLASKWLKDLSEKGRNVGIHMLLGSQRFGAAYMMYRDAIFGNIHLRMAMKMSDADVKALTEFGKEGRLYVATCDLPGKIVINDDTGNDGQNNIGKIAFLTEKERTSILSQISDKVDQLDIANDTPQTIIFDGKEQPRLIENPQISRLLSLNNWLTPKEWEALAKKDIVNGGFSDPSWFAGEHPRLIWLGQEFNVHGQAKVTLKRQSGENVMIIGDRNDVRYGMLASSIVSLALNGNKTKNLFFIVDRSIPGTDWSDTLANVCAHVLKPSEIQYNLVRKTDLVIKIINKLITVLKKRTQLARSQELNTYSIFLIITEADRIDELCRQPDEYGGFQDSELLEKLQLIYTKGPSLGIHVLLSFSGLISSSSIIDNSRLSFFKHRVALQMSENDSFTFMESRKASQLQQDGDKPTNAVYSDIRSAAEIKFKPYSVVPKSDFIHQLKTIGKTLKKWRSA